MKKSVLVLAMFIVALTSLTSCCKVCRKEGQNNVEVCRNNYDNDEDYNSAIGWYQVGGFTCN